MVFKHNYGSSKETFLECEQLFIYIFLCKQILRVYSKGEIPTFT